MPRYGKPHKYFLQAMMNRGLVSEPECISMYQQCFAVENIEINDNFEDFLDVVNRQIHCFHFKVKQSRREDTGETVYVLVSLAENELNKLAINGDFSRQELEFFRRILELVVHANDLENVGRISSIAILNLADEITPKMSKVDASKLLDRLVDDKWLYESEGMISLSPRSILELEKYLSETYAGDLKQCHMCNKRVFLGQSCEHCFGRMHNFCASRYFSNTDKCSLCGKHWPLLYQSTLTTTKHSASTSEQTSELLQSRKRARLH